ncbi:MAG: cytochrome c3 family protein [Candidatus Binatia bacterium]
MTRFTRIAVSVCLPALSCLVLARPAWGGIEHTIHNFSVSGPQARGAPPRAPAVSGTAPTVGICVFCHTPHNANPTAGLWNHRLPAVSYKLYESSTLQAQINQPTGSSRLCLSCHDGTLALGDLRVHPRGAHLSVATLSGRASLGTDLSDDHPVSFLYDIALASRQGALANPGALPPEVRLDKAGQMQCTSCHDPHQDKFDHFLVMDNRGARLCTACHHIKGWSDSSHATSPATQTRTGANPWPHTPYVSVADNGCENCHRQHAAGHPEWLLLNRTVSEDCFTCHDGSVAARDVRRSFNSLSSHPVEVTEALHQPNEDPLFMKRHVACGDCHDPHSVRAGTRPSAGAPPRGALGTMEVTGAVAGVDAAGGRVRQARTEYEVCYKCHGLQEEATFLVAPRFMLVRNDNVTNVRLQFSTNNVSFHPVEAVGRNPTISGFEAGYTPSTILSCTDCHNSDESDAADTRAVRGPHGSAYEPILVREYQVGDPSQESYQSYALCYRCHNRTALLSDTGGFPHRLHVVDQQASCAVCHDAHGSRQNLFLVNFLARGKTGNAVVTPSASTKQLEFQSFGRGRGQCSLTCHGSEHNARQYPAPTTPSQKAVPLPARQRNPMSFGVER